MRAGSESAQMFDALRRHLRREGWTAPRLASHLGIGEATAKRRLAGKSLSLERLEELAGLVGLTLSDIAREAERGEEGLARELTLAQERALPDDPFLAFLFFIILRGSRPEELEEEHGFPSARITVALERLERLALIDRLKGGRLRSRVNRNATFNKLPLRHAFESYMKQHFMEMDFSAPDTIFTSEVLELSAVGAARLAEEIERHHRAVCVLAERDHERALLKCRWYGVLWAVRPLDLSRLHDRVTGAGTDS